MYILVLVEYCLRKMSEYHQNHDYSICHHFDQMDLQMTTVSSFNSFFPVYICPAYILCYYPLSFVYAYSGAAQLNGYF